MKGLSELVFELRKEVIVRKKKKASLNLILGTRHTVERGRVVEVKNGTADRWRVVDNINSKIRILRDCQTVVCSKKVWLSSKFQIGWHQIVSWNDGLHKGKAETLLIGDSQV
ncbi:UNVERIFIED_CONTAM: hypothetical protein RMT77_017697 [Armadillidium vulgare]